MKPAKHDATDLKKRKKQILRHGIERNLDETGFGNEKKKSIECKTVLITAGGCNRA